MTTPNPKTPNPPLDLKKLVSLWAACCTSPLIYLAVAIFIKRTFMSDGGFLKLEPYTWSRLTIGLAVLIILLQALHIAVKVKARRRFAEFLDDRETFRRLLTRRTFLLIAVSELAVFSGFVLFLLQGEYTPVFLSGIASMILYAQSHPRLGLPPVLPRDL